MLRVALLVLATLLPASVTAAVLYKSVDENGTIMFSDVPPGPDARILETRELPTVGEPQPGEAPAIGGEPIVLASSYDGDIARANARVDQAEHELALARQELLAPRAGLRLEGGGMSQADEARIAYYKRNVVAARQELMLLMRERQYAEVRERQLALRQ